MISHEGGAVADHIALVADLKQALAVTHDGIDLPVSWPGARFRRNVKHLRVSIITGTGSSVQAELGPNAARWTTGQVTVRVIDPNKPGLPDDPATAWINRVGETAQKIADWFTDRAYRDSELARYGMPALATDPAITYQTPSVARTGPGQTRQIATVWIPWRSYRTPQAATARAGALSATVMGAVADTP